MGKATPFSAAAFMAAAAAAAQQKPKPVHLAGVGHCFQRDVTVADVEEAQAIRVEREKAGKQATKSLNMAIGLAQSLCGPDGTPIFDPRNEEHITLLGSLPWAAVRAMNDAQDASDEAEGDPAKNA